MRFKASIKNISVFIKIVASLGLLAKVAWVRLDNDQIRFTVIPEHGSQVWAVINIDSIFDEDFLIQSANNNTINLEVPLDSLHRALKTAQHAMAASIRLTKKDNTPLLSLTIAIPTPLTSSGRQTRNLDLNAGYNTTATGYREGSHLRISQDLTDDPISATSFASGGSRETTITQDVAVRVLAAQRVEGIHEPHAPEAEVHILLPPLLQLKAISERFTKLGVSSKSKTTGLQSGSMGPKLELSANMHGELKMGIKTDALKIESRWEGLTNPELDPEQVAGGVESIQNHPSTRMRGLTGEEGWATVRVDAKDWGRVLGVGRVAGRVVACFCDDRALILYVYLSNEEIDGSESVLTYYISCYSA